MFHISSIETSWADLAQICFSVVCNCQKRRNFWEKFGKLEESKINFLYVIFCAIAPEWIFEWKIGNS